MTANTPKDPIDGVTEWTNEETGVKYQYIDGAWRAVSSKAIEDLLSQFDGAAIYYGDYEPIVDTYELWYDTTRLELFVNYEGMWFPAAAGSGGGGSQDLQQVLEQGSVANKGFLLTNAENDAILVSPEEGRVMLGGFGNGVVPSYELRHTNSTQDSAVVKLELDEDGERFDIECDEKVNNIHFRFENEAKLDINKKGDAVFEGKVRVQPGTAENEVVTYQQLQELEEEIEDIRPSLERGRWTFATNMAPGQYNIYLNHTDQYCNTKLAECMAEADDPTAASDCQREYTACLEKGDSPIEEWTGTKIWFNQLDLNSTLHQWDTIEPGEKLEIVNEDGSGFALYEVADGNITASGGRIGIPVTHERSNGVPSGAAKVKLFTLSDADPADFVHKSGDTISGRLNVYSKDTSTLELRAGGSSSSTANVFWIEDASRNLIFNVAQNGNLWAKDGYTPSNSRHLTPKKFVDDNFVNKTGDTIAGKLTIQPTSASSSTNSLAIYSKDDAADNQYCIYNYGKLYTPEGSDTAKRDVIFYTTVNGDVGAGTSWLPTKSFHLANKKYVDNLVAPSPVNFSWKYTGPNNQSDRLVEGEFYGPEQPVFDGTQYFSWYFHLTPNSAAGRKFGSYEDKLLYHFSNYQVIGSFWYDNNGEWKHKGHIWIRELEFKYKSRNVIRVNGYHIRNSSDEPNGFASGLSTNFTYGFTIGGFF